VLNCVGSTHTHGLPRRSGPQGARPRAPDSDSRKSPSRARGPARVRRDGRPTRARAWRSASRGPVEPCRPGPSDQPRRDSDAGPRGAVPGRAPRPGDSSLHSSDGTTDLPPRPDADYFKLPPDAPRPRRMTKTVTRVQHCHWRPVAHRGVSVTVYRDILNQTRGPRPAAAGGLPTRTVSCGRSRAGRAPRPRWPTTAAAHPPPA
jgi:hypothetical protein